MSRHLHRHALRDTGTDEGADSRAPEVVGDAATGHGDAFDLPGGQLRSRSEWPSDFSGATRPRTSCFSSLISGNRPCSALDQMTAPPTLTSKTPPVPGTRVTPISFSNVVRSLLSHPIGAQEPGGTGGQYSISSAEGRSFVECTPSHPIAETNWKV